MRIQQKTDAALALAALLSAFLTILSNLSIAKIHKN